LGAPVKVHLLSDLLNPEFDVSDIKLAVFLNAFVISDGLRVAIDERLNGDGRTLAWVYAPGILNGSSCAKGACTPNVTMASDLVGIPLSMSLGNPASLTSTFVTQSAHPLAGTAEPVLPPELNGTVYGAGLGLVSPWFSCGGSDADGDGDRSDGSNVSDGGDGRGGVGGGGGGSDKDGVDTREALEDVDPITVLARYTYAADEATSSTASRLGRQGTPSSICWRHRTSTNASAIFIGASVGALSRRCWS
jgi:hypothetical protein